MNAIQTRPATSSLWATLAARVGVSRRASAIESSGGTLRIQGALDKRLAKEVKVQARAFAESDATALTIDLSGVTHWDSDGLASLVYALDVSLLAGKSLQLVDPNQRLRETFTRTQLHHLFSIVQRADLA